MAIYIVTWTDMVTHIQHHTAIDPVARPVDMASLVAATELGETNSRDRVRIDRFEVKAA